MKTFKLFIVIVLTFLSFNATATQGKWVQGYGQGNLEYFIDKGNVRLYIGCPSQESNSGGDSRVMLSIESNSPVSGDIKAFKIEAGGDVFDGPIVTGSRVGTNNFIGLIASLQKSDAKVTFANKVIIFPKSNITSVLHTYQSGKLGCAIN